jgi:uncharacterized protein YcfL
MKRIITYGIIILVLLFLMGCNSNPKPQITLKGQENIVLTGNVTITPNGNPGCLEGYSWSQSKEKCLKS